MEISKGLNKEVFGERVQNRRLERGLTREELAEKIDCSVVFLAEVESGKKLVRVENLYYMALILNTSTDYLLDLDGGYNKEEKDQRQDMLKDANDVLRSLDTKDLNTAVNILKALSKSVK